MVLVTQAAKYLEPQIRLAAKVGKHKKEYKLSMISDRTLEKVSNLAAVPIEAVFTDPSYGKVHSTFLGAADCTCLHVFCVHLHVMALGFSV